MAARPLVLPDTFSGDKSWNEWIYHFENVAAVNRWDAAAKLLWLKVRLTGKAQTAFQRFPDAVRTSYDDSVQALKDRFEPDARRERYKAEFQVRRKKKEESWADFADDLKLLVDKSYPDLAENAKEQLALNHYLNQLSDPQVSFSVKQKRPTTLDEAVSATLEMESYLKPVPPAIAGAVETGDDNTEDPAVASVRQSTEDTAMLQAIMSRLELIERKVHAEPSSNQQQPRSRIICWNCGRPGHVARVCREPRRRREGPGQPPKKTPINAFQGVSTARFSLPCRLNGVATSLIIDTGAAVSLISSKLWRHCVPGGTPSALGEGEQLVGVEGAPLSVMGTANMEITVEEKSLYVRMFIVDSLTAEGILGIDFLRNYHCIVDIPNTSLRFAQWDISIPLNDRERTQQFAVHLVSTQQVPPWSEMELVAEVESTDIGGAWLMESNNTKTDTLIFARSVVQPRHGQIPVRVLNHSQDVVTLPKGTRIATLEKPAHIFPAQTKSIGGVQQEKPSPPDHMSSAVAEVVERCSQNLSREEKEKLSHLLTIYSNIFTHPGQPPGRTSKLQHTINTGNNKPIKQRVRRVSPSQRQVIKALVDDMLEKDMIAPSDSPWASPIVLVKKKDGSDRFCVDYRKVNEITRKDAFPLPRIDDTLDSLAGSQWFTTLDLTSGYWQVEVSPEDRSKTAFCTTEGLFEFKVMPFGLCNAPATFQRLMNLILGGLQMSACLVYLDDIIVLGRNFEDHLKNLAQVFSRVHQAGLKLKPGKCWFFQDQVQYLGHIVSREGIAADPAKVEVVKSWPVPTTTKEVQRFLGFAGYYRRFIQNFSEVAQPLHRLIEKNKPFKWTPECQEAFAKLRFLLTSTPVLAYPNYDRPFILDTDASDVGIGAVLSQLDDDGQERVIAFGSRMLTKPERRYCVTRKELLAAVAFTKQFRPYLLGRHFTLRTDHGSLVWLTNFKDPEGQLARWLEQLQQFDFEVIHRKGRKHTNADSLSRLPCPQCGRQQSCHNNQVAFTSLSLSQSDGMRLKQLQDPIIGPILQAKEAATAPPPPHQQAEQSIEARRLFQLWDQLFVFNGVLCRRSQTHDQIVVPAGERKVVLEQLHSGAFGGHLGQDKMISKLKTRFYWPGHWKDVREWCRTCHVCATKKTPAPKNKAPLQPVTVGSPMQMIAVDILGPLPKSAQGNSYVLVMSDYFTRWMETFPIPNQEAHTVAKKLVDEVFCRFSVPEQLHSDQGRQFESDLISEICTLLHIDKTRTTPYHPQSDGLVERFNRTLISMLATCVGEHPDEWEDHLHKVCMAYNSSEQATTGYSPFYLMFGREARIPVDLLYPPPSQHDCLPRSQYAQQLQTSLHNAYALVREHLAVKHRRQKELYNRKVHGSPHPPESLVWLFNPAVPRGRSRKFHRPWTGPYKIVKQLSQATYRIQHTANHCLKTVHFDRLKRCPSNIRLPVPRSFPRPHIQPPRSPSPPPGTNLELIPDSHPLPNPAPPDLPPPPAPGASRYPSRPHRSPTRYGAFVRH